MVELNRHLKGWENYFKLGYPAAAFRDINSYVHSRLKQHLRRRSQRLPTAAGGERVALQCRPLSYIYRETSCPTG
ncbi:MAG: hypothetical protein HY820_25465 [Acidobacteria bacterium]|nr:hypothetical protein [Acidobacteriota bacterium]